MLLIVSIGDLNIYLIIDEKDMTSMISPKVFWKKNRRYSHFWQYWALSAIYMETQKNSVGNDVICQTIFQFYKKFHDRFE